MKQIVCLILSALLLSSCMFTDRRGVSTVYTDKDITKKINYDVNHNLTESSHSHSHIVVTAYNHKVLLTGQVPHDNVKQQLGQLAMNTPEVQKVYNEVSIGPVTGLTQRTTDAWISAKINSLLTASNNTGLMRVQVITENDVVYLMGLVTPEEAELATEKARSVTGVKEVVKLFDFVNS